MVNFSVKKSTCCENHSNKISTTSTAFAATSTLSWYLVLVIRPTERLSMTQGPFRWVRTQGRSPHTSSIAKNILEPQAPSNQPNLPTKGVKVWGDDPEAGGNIQCRGIPGQIHAKI